MWICLQFRKPWRAQETWTLCLLGMIPISLFYCAITQKWMPILFAFFFSLSRFNKTVGLEDECAEGEAWSKRVQQHFVHPHNPWCDTTSRVHGIGKGASLKKFLVSHHFHDQAQVFNITSASKKDVVAAGEKTLVCLCNGKSDEGLDSLRCWRYCEKVATSQVQPQRLPPTSAAAMYHSLRAYFHVQRWKGVGETMSTEECGWKDCDGLFLLVTTHLPTAPEAFLRVIRCNCPTHCSSLKCTCRKHNLECSAVCGQCRDSGCTNSVQMDDSECSCEDDNDS